METLRATLRARRENVGDIAVFDEPLFDDSAAEGRRLLLEAGETVELLAVRGRVAFWRPRADRECAMFLTYWPHDHRKARWLGKNEPLDEVVAWTHYDG